MMEEHLFSSSTQCSPFILKYSLIFLGDSFHLNYPKVLKDFWFLSAFESKKISFEKCGDGEYEKDGFSSFFKCRQSPLSACMMSYISMPNSSLKGFPSNVRIVWLRFW